MKNSSKPKKKPLYQPGVPEEIKAEAIKCTLNILGTGYVSEYYQQITEDYLWLYEDGYLAGFKAGQGHANKNTKKQ